MNIPDPYSIPLEDIDLSNPHIFQQDAHWGYFERLRAEDPVHYCANSDFGPFWSVTKFADIMHVDTSHDIFSSEPGITLGPPVSMPEEQMMRTPMFIAMDPPKHDVQRATVNPVVTPRNLAALEGTIRERAAGILDALPRDETFNWVDLPEGSFNTQLARTRFTYTVTPRMFFSGLLQYSSGGDSFSTNFRFRWEYSPGSELFVVYSEDRDTDPLMPDRFTELRNRGLVVKVTRLFRL